MSKLGLIAYTKIMAREEEAAADKVEQEAEEAEAKRAKEQGGVARVGENAAGPLTPPYKKVFFAACCPGWCSTSMSSYSGPRYAAQEGRQAGGQRRTHLLVSGPLHRVLAECRSSLTSCPCVRAQVASRRCEDAGMAGTRGRQGVRGVLVRPEGDQLVTGRARGRWASSSRGTDPHKKDGQ